MGRATAAYLVALNNFHNADHSAIDRNETVYSVYVLNDKRRLIWATTDLADDGKWTLVFLPNEYSDGPEGM